MFSSRSYPQSLNRLNLICALLLPKTWGLRVRLDNRIHDRDNRLRESKFGGGRRLGAGHGKEEIAGSTADRPIAVYYAQFSRDRPIGGELFDLLDKMLNALRSSEKIICTRSIPRSLMLGSSPWSAAISSARMILSRSKVSCDRLTQSVLRLVLRSGFKSRLEIDSV